MPDRNSYKLALSIQDKLINLEQNDDRQLAQAARFLSELCDVQIESGLPIIQFQDAINAAIDCITMRGASRVLTVDMHNSLIELAGRVGFEIRDEGGHPRPNLTPWTGGKRSEPVKLKAVSTKPMA